MPRRAPGLRTCAIAASLAIALCLSAGAQDNGAVADGGLYAGRAALEDELWVLAETQFRTYLALADKGSPQADRATLLLAQALEGQGKYTEMLQLLPSARRRGPFAFWHAMALHRLERHKEALNELRGVEESTGDAGLLVRAERLRARCHLAEGRLAEALKLFESVESRFGASHPGSAANLLDWARALHAQGRTSESRAILDKLIARSGDSASGHAGRHLLGRQLNDDRKWAEAETVLKSLTAEDGASTACRARAFYTLATGYDARGRATDATNALHSGIALTPSSDLKRKGEILLGRQLLKMRRLDDGVALLKRHIAAKPQDPLSGELQLELSAALLDAGRAGEAAEEYQHYLETFSDPIGRARALSGKGWSLLSTPKPMYAEAASLFGKAAELFEDPADKANCLFKVADAHFQNAQYRTAIGTYERLITTFPTSDLVKRARFQTAEAVARDGDKPRAEQLFGQFVEKNPSHAFAEHAQLRIAELKGEQGQQRAALAAYDSFLGTYTNGTLYVTALHARGLICYRMLRFAKALEDFERVLALAPESEHAEQAFYMRGWCHQMMGRDKEAMSTCEAFIQRFPRSKWAPEVMLWLGEYEFAHGRHQEAEQLFLDVAARYPAVSAAQAGLLRAGKTAAMQKEYLRAIEHFETLARTYPSSDRLPQARYSQGDALSELGKFASAILVYDEVIRRYADSYLADAAAGRKGDCQFALGHDEPRRYTEAMESYQSVVDSKTARGT